MLGPNHVVQWTLRWLPGHEQAAKPTWKVCAALHNDQGSLPHRDIFD
jgi:hypothetical protein